MWTNVGVVGDEEVEGNRDSLSSSSSSSSVSFDVSNLGSALQSTHLTSRLLSTGPHSHSCPLWG